MTPAGGLKLFLDRSTNSKQFAAGVRLLVADVVTIGERYGVAAAEQVKDPRWLADATAEGRICIGADKAILSNELELAAVLECEARYAVFSNNNITGREQLARFASCLPPLEELAERAGPWAAMIGASGLSEVSADTLRDRLAKLRARPKS